MSDKPPSPLGFPAWIRCLKCGTTRPPQLLEAGVCRDGWCSRARLAPSSAGRPSGETLSVAVDGVGAP